jgi:hypothetical protein
MTATTALQNWLQRAARAGKVALVLGALAATAIPVAQEVHADMSMPGMGSTSGVDSSDSGMDMQMTPITGTPSAADQAKVAAVLAATKAATSQYADINLAIAGGYTHHTPFFPSAHFSNYQYAALANRAFDPTRPTSLLYAIVNGAPTLAGVMYTAPATDTPAQLAQILPSTIVSWHQHFNICYTATGGVRTGVSQPTCEVSGGRWAPKSQWMVHAWIYFPNPDGMFSIKNPALPWPKRHR